MNTQNTHNWGEGPNGAGQTGRHCSTTMPVPTSPRSPVYQTPHLSILNTKGPGMEKGFHFNETQFNHSGPS